MKLYETLYMGDPDLWNPVSRDYQKIPAIETSSPRSTRAVAGATSRLGCSAGVVATAL